MRENLRREHGQVMTAVRLPGDMKILRGVFRELLEEKGEESIDVSTSGGRGGDGTAAVRETNVDGLVQKDDRGVRVP